MQPELLLIAEPKPAIVLLTLNRPDTLNSINMALCEALISALDRLATDPSVRAIIVTGAGDRAFSAGFDIREMEAFDAGTMLGAFIKRDPLFWRIASHSKPVIAAINGIAYGAGALISASADIRVGCENSTFRVTASKYNAANATWTLPHIVGAAKAKEILLTGRAVSPDEAHKIGLFNYLVSPKEVLEKSLAIATAISANAPQGVQNVKALINDGLGHSLLDQYRAEHLKLISASTWPTGKSLFSEFIETHAKVVG